MSEEGHTSEAAAGVMLAAALDYVAQGHRVFPLKAGAKTPLTASGFKDASSDEKQVREWWRRWPDANIGTPTGERFDVLDVDMPKNGSGANGLATLSDRELPKTFAVLTPSGGRHFYFPAGSLGRNTAKLLPGLDTRSRGGYVAVPPSVVDGRAYKVMTRAAIAEPPTWLLSELSKGSRTETPTSGDTVREGGRNDYLARLAGKLRREGLDKAELAAALLAANKSRCQPPLAEGEVRRIAESVARYKPASKQVTWKRGSAVEVRPILFVDKPLLQADAFHLVVARKGQGKGTLLAAYAAAVTRGELGPKKNVVWIASEDSAAIDIVPRILVAGGDPDKLLVVDEGWVQLPRDYDEIEAAIVGFGEVGMLVIDPVANHIAGRDSNKDEVREAIGPLNKLADRHQLLLFGVRHLTEKDASKGVLAAILGSSAWVQVPRVVLGIARDSEDPAVAHIQVIAGNRLPPDTPGRMFRIDGVTFRDFPEQVTRATWLGESTKSVESLLAVTREPSKSAKARDLILELLEAAPDRQMESDALDALVSKRTGLAANTVRNQRGQLKDAGLVRALPEKDENGTVIRWLIARTLAPRPEPAVQTPSLYAEHGIWTKQAVSGEPDTGSAYTGSGPVTGESGTAAPTPPAPASTALRAHDARARVENDEAGLDDGTHAPA